MDNTNNNINGEPAPAPSEEKFLSVNAIHKELEETTIKTDAIVHRIKALTDEVAKLKESLMIMTGAKLAFQKIVDASKKQDSLAETSA